MPATTWKGTLPADSAGVGLNFGCWAPRAVRDMFPSVVPGGAFCIAMVTEACKKKHRSDPNKKGSCDHGKDQLKEVQVEVVPAHKRGPSSEATTQRADPAHALHRETLTPATATRTQGRER